MKEDKQKFWSQPLRVEAPEYAQLATSRCINSALWFVNNKKLEERIYAFLAKRWALAGREIAQRRKTMQMRAAFALNMWRNIK